MVINFYKNFTTQYLTNLASHRTFDHRLSLLLVLGLGLFLRLYSLYVGEAFHVFSINDDIVALNAALELARVEGSSWYIGPSSFSGGSAAGPLWTLFILIIYKVGFSSISGALFIMALLSMFSIYLLYRIALIYFPPQYALFTTLLFATSPWAIYYSVGLYCPMPTIFLGELLFLALWKTLTIHDSKSIIFVFILAAILPQFHMITIFYLPAILLLLWLSKIKFNIQYLIFGSIIGFSFYLPYLIGDGLNDWENTRLVLAGTGKPFSYSTFKVLSAPVTVLSNAPTDWIGREADGFEGYKNYATKYFFHYTVLMAINLINLIILFSIFFKFIGSSISLVWTNKFTITAITDKHIKFTFLFLLIILPLLLFVLTGKNYSTRYTLIMLSLLFIMQVFVILKLKNKKITKFLIVYFLINIIFSVYITITHYNYKNILINTSSTFLPSLKKLESIKQSIYKQTPDGAYITIMFSKSITSLPESQRKLYSALAEFIDLDNRTKFKSSTTQKKILVIRGDENFDKIKYPNILYSSPSINVLSE